jgi:hypothetical protein
MADSSGFGFLGTWVIGRCRMDLRQRSIGLM